MSTVTRNNVKYTLKNNYYIVGDGSETDSNGITSRSYSGTITIPYSIDGIAIKEIGQYSFRRCEYLTKVFINAKITKIGVRAFGYCFRLEYINIPLTVTRIESAAFCLNSGNGKAASAPMTIEFNAVRKKSVTIEGDGFEARQTFYVIYPSDISPIYRSKYAFEYATSVYICAPKVFTFGNKQTTTDMSKCPNPIFKPELEPTINPNLAKIKVLLLSLLIPILSQLPMTTKHIRFKIEMKHKNKECYQQK